MWKNTLIISLAVIVIVSVLLNYIYIRKVTESKDLLIKSLLSKLSEKNSNNGITDLSSTWAKKMNEL